MCQNVHVGLQSTPESYVVFDTSSYFIPSWESRIKLRFCSLWMDRISHPSSAKYIGKKVYIVAKWFTICYNMYYWW